MMPRIEFEPEDLAHGPNGPEPFISDPVKNKRVEEIFERVGELDRIGELRVYRGDAARYIYLGGNDEKFLRLANIMGEHGDIGAMRDLPLQLPKLQDLKRRHPELFQDFKVAIEAEVVE